MHSPGNTGIMKKMLPSFFGSGEGRGDLLTDILGGLPTPINPHIESWGFPFAIMKDHTDNWLGRLGNIDVTATPTAEVHPNMTLNFLNYVGGEDSIMALNERTFAPQSMA